MADTRWSASMWLRTWRLLGQTTLETKMQRIPNLLCIATLLLCGVLATMTTADPQEHVTVGQFSHVKINQPKDATSALDIYPTGGKAVRFFSWESKQRGPRTYFNDVGMFYTQGWVTISGTMEGDGEDYRIEPPSLDPSMLYVWSDVIGPAIEVRTANTDDQGSYIFQAMGRNAEYTFSIEQSGGLRWGAASRAEMDTNLYRAAPKTLKTDGSLIVGGSQSVRRTPAASDYSLTDSDYYVGVTDTTAGRTITVPNAAGRSGRVYVVKDESGEAGTNRIIVNAQAGETIDGSASQLIDRNYGVLRIISNGTNWFTM